MVGLRLSIVALMTFFLAGAQDSQPKTAGKSQMSEVANEVRLIEQDSLPLDPSLQSSTRPLDSTAPRASSSLTDSALTERERASRVRSTAALTEAGRSEDNGIKLYRFTLASKETLTTQIKSDDADIITQRFGLLIGPSFTPSAASKSQINRINRLSRQQRSSKIEFSNPEDRPFPLLLIVYGRVGHAYKIEISREQPR